MPAAPDPAPIVRRDSPARTAGERSGTAATPPGSRTWWTHPATVAAAFLLAGAGTTLTLLARSGALTPEVLPGLPVPSSLVAWALPTAKVVGDLAAVAAVGALLVAAVFVPGHRQLSVAGYRCLRLAGAAAVVWCASAVMMLPLQLADFLGAGLPMITVRGLASFATTIPQGQGQLLVIVATGVLAVAAGRTLTTGGSLGLLVLGVAAALPPVFTGHAAGSGSHQAAVSGLLLHVVGVLLWAGALVALLLVRALPLPAVQAAVGRFSAMAPVLVVVVAGSGVITASTRLTGLSDLVTTSYGMQVLGKTVLLLVAGMLGVAHRRSTLPRLRVGRPGAFRRLATVEVVVFAAAIGTAVSLSRTPTPQATGAPLAEEGTAAELLGFPPPAEPAPGAWWSQLVQPYPDPLWPVVVGAMAVLYVLAVRAAGRTGPRWPRRRTAAAVAGMTVLLVATSSGLARYAFVTQTAHLVQYLLLGLVAPALLVLGCQGLPARALPVGDPDDEFRDPRRWWDVARASALAGYLRRPQFALAAAAVVFYGGTTGPVLEVVLRSHVAHLLSVAVTVAAGCVLTSSWFGPAGKGGRPPRWITAWVSVHLAASLVLLVWPRVLARGWWAEVAPAWVDSSVDQRAAAITSLVGGLVVAVAALGAARTARLAATAHEPVAGSTPS